MTKRLVIIDGMSVFYRGYFAMPGLSLPDGTPTGGVFGFASIAIEVIKQLEPDYVAVAWDIRGTSTTKRSEIYPEYKAGRTKPPDDFYAQMPILHALLESFGWPLYELKDYEADDIMGTFAAAATEKGTETCIVTGDYDMLQLISDTVSVYITKKGSELLHFDTDAFVEKYGVNVDQFIDYKALVGDSSDNIPGVRKIGPKAAQKLLGDYQTLDGIYQHLDDLKGAQKQYLYDDKNNAYMSQKLARIFCDAPVTLDWNEADINNTNLAGVASKLHELEFHSLIRRLPKHMQEIKVPVETTKASLLREIEWSDSQSFDSSRPVLIHLEGSVVWVSQSDTTVAHTALSAVDKSFWRSLEYVPVVSYDLKVLYHTAHQRGTELQFAAAHDIRQAAFLINPLARDRSLEVLSGADPDEPSAVVAGLWRMYHEQITAFEKNERLFSIARDFDFPLTYVLYKMETRGIKIDPDMLATMSKSLEKQYIDAEQKMYSLVGYEFNIASPAQLSEVLFTKLQLPATGIKRGKTGYSTGQRELDKLRGQHPIIELIERTRELAKMKNTYVDALPKLTDDNNRLHTTYNQDVASTGRLSSTNPNLQNIPIRSKIGREIRSAFIPNRGNVFVNADYSQFELRLAAVLASDTVMINDFNGDTDIHTKTASDVYGISMDDVTKDQRRAAKVINFGVLYGMSPHGLAAATGMNFTAAKQFIDQYFELRQPIRAYIDTTLERALNEGYVETYYGRRRPTPDVQSSNFMVREAAKRAAANLPIQGTEADLMKRAMIRVEDKLRAVDGAKQILQIHDSIMVEVPKESAEKVSDILKETMESVAPELNVKLRVDVAIGDDWSEV